MNHRACIPNSAAAVAWSIVLAGALMLLLACGGPPGENGPSAAETPRSGEAPQTDGSEAWHRHDLWLDDPSIAYQPEELGQQKAWSRQVVYLGANEVRELDKVTAFQRQQIPRLAASEVRALQQVAGSRLVFTVEVGDQPYFSFIPLVDRRHPWATLYRVSARALGEPSQGGAEEQVLHEEWVRVRALPAQAAVTVSLEAFAGQTIELLLDAEMEEPVAQRPRPRRAQWVSPAVYYRAPLSKDSKAGEARQNASAQRPNILLIGADTLRADHLGAYGASPSLTPGLDRLAKESDVWLNATSCFNVTNPSFISLMTGLYGKNHGIYDLTTPLPDSYTTLAEVFSDAGYDTLAVIAARHLRHRNSGLGQGFDEVTVSGLHFAAELVADMGMDWIAEHTENGDAPFFAWLHMFDPHTPHTPPAPFGLGFHPDRSYGLAPVDRWLLHRTPGWPSYTYMPLGGSSELYAGEVSYLDRQVDRLMDFLRSRGLLENTLVVFIADHGENLADHGVRYGHHGLFETTVHVPLMVRWPGAEGTGRRFEELVQNVDVFPTLLAAAGLEAPESDGTDLRAIADGEERSHRAVFSEHSHALGTRIRTRDHSYMVSMGNNFYEDGRYLFDLRTDPGEENNLAGTGLAVEDELHRALQGWLQTRRETDTALPADLTEEDIERLRALGYL
ncbi:MAG: sulfatase [Acidobacteriota bacterium]|nr:sulfatase [Acidobacteriota bacterium]